MELSNFINRIQDLIQNKKQNQIIPYIKNVNGFLESLNELKEIIGMSELKNNVVSQIKYYFITKARLSQNQKINSDSHMFHTVLLGPPGSGKTTAAEILAKIWTNLGIIKDEPVEVNILKTSEEEFGPSQFGMSDSFIRPDKEKDLLHSSVSRLLTESLKSKLELKNIKVELLTEKEKITEFQEYIEKCKENIGKDISQDMKRKLVSMESGIEYIIKKCIGSVKRPGPIDATCYDNKEDFKVSLETKHEDSDKLNEAFINPETTFSIPEPLKFIKLRRDDLIGKYCGHTAVKTREALMKGLGKVIFIDEAYELYNVVNDVSSDSFGMECLNTILNFMNEFSDRVIFIFAGYEDLLKNTIFRVQPGLERRIAWSFNLNPYSEEELVQIYEKQLKEKSWNLQDKDKIINLFKTNKKIFKHGGGDTLRLAMYTKTVYSDVCFEKLLMNEEITSSITYDIVVKALNILKENSDNQKIKTTDAPQGMYC